MRISSKILIFVFFFLLLSLAAALFLREPSLFWINKESQSENNNLLQENNSEQDLTEKELKAKIGQMLMTGFRGAEINEDSAIVEAIKELNLGAVVLFDFDVPSNSFPRNIVDFNQTKKLIDDLRSFSPALLLAVDVEGGRVNRLKPEYGFLPLSSPKSLAQMDETEARREMEVKAQEMSELGFNMNLAPVVDVDFNPNNPIVGALGRSFSSDPEIVSQYGRIFIDAFQSEGIVAVAKHFPGHGSSTQDSHLGLVDVTNVWKEEELLPYKNLEKNEALKVVMTAHIFNKNIDPSHPATLSPAFLKEILRFQIGFEGVIISDDMQMGAIDNHYSLEEAIIRAINAGCDILSFSNNSSSGYDEEIAYKAVEIIMAAVEDGRISKQRIIEASDRVYRLKKDFGIVTPDL
jgi:beta-N-acetylhexosaminidase